VRRPDDFRRPSQNRSILPKVLIACEGSSTEPGYFKALKDDTSVTTVNILLVRHPGGTEPRRVVQAAIDAREELRAVPGRWLRGDQAWAVFDGDEHIANDSRSWQETLTLACKESVSLAVSNPCFELWYLVHFEDQFGHLTAAQATKKLGRHIQSYEKAAVLYPRLKDRMPDALRRADQMERNRQLNDYPPHHNPTTEVRRLIRKILDIQDKADRTQQQSARDRS